MYILIQPLALERMKIYTKLKYIKTPSTIEQLKKKDRELVLEIEKLFKKSIDTK